MASHVSTFIPKVRHRMLNVGRSPGLLKVVRLPIPLSQDSDFVDDNHSSYDEMLKIFSTCLQLREQLQSFTEFPFNSHTLSVRNQNSTRKYS